MMEEEDGILGGLLAHLRASVGRQVNVLSAGDGRLSLRIGADPRSVLGLRVEDAARPSFEVTYPALRVKRDGRRHEGEVVVKGVLVQGVEWITRQLARDGAVRPELE